MKNVLKKVGYALVDLQCISNLSHPLEPYTGNVNPHADDWNEWNSIFAPAISSLSMSHAGSGWSPISSVGTCSSWGPMCDYGEDWNVPVTNPTGVHDAFVCDNKPLRGYDDMEE